MNGRSIREHDLKHGPDALPDSGNSLLLKKFGEFAAQFVRNSPSVPERFTIALSQLAQTRSSGMQANSRRIVSAEVQHSAPGQGLHYFGTSREGSHRQSASERFAESHKIGLELVMLLTTAKGDAETGDGLVQNEQN